jgi:pyruvate dehydrogenase phosphatase
MTELGIQEYAFVPMERVAAEELLKQNEITTVFKPSDAKSVVTRFDNNYVNCNEIGEDRHVEDFFCKGILSEKRSAATAEDDVWLQLSDDGDGDLKLFSVIDGHGGVAMADLLVERLHPSIIRALRTAQADRGSTPLDPISAMREVKEGISSFAQSYKPFGCSASMEDSQCFPEGDPSNLTVESISSALTSAYMDLDHEVCVQPLMLLAAESSNQEQLDFQKISSQAIAGACAATILVDEDRQEVHVANLGDTRVVAGYWVSPRTWPNGAHFQGGWRCEVLTEDHNARDPKEMERYVRSVVPVPPWIKPDYFLPTSRLKREHPGEDNLVADLTYRLLGLIPTRTFGKFTP